MYDDEYIKTKIKWYGGIINRNFQEGSEFSSYENELRKMMHISSY